MLVFKDLCLGAGPFNDTRLLAANTVRLIIELLLATAKPKTNRKSSAVVSSVGIPYKEVWYREGNMVGRYRSSRKVVPVPWHKPVKHIHGPPVGQHIATKNAVSVAAA